MSSFSKEIEAAIAQLLASLTATAAYVLLLKHVDYRPPYGWDTVESYLLQIQRSSDAEARELLLELVTDRADTRRNVLADRAYEAALEDLRRWVRHDGWRIEDGALVRETPAIEDATQVRQSRRRLPARPS